MKYVLIHFFMLLCATLSAATVSDVTAKQRFRRSVLAGGLPLGDGRIPCAYCDDCKLFGLNECRI